MTGLDASVPSVADLRDADTALRRRVVETPLVDAPQLAKLAGARRVRVKLETQQLTGSFKFRGAMWRCMNLSEEERKRGVVAYSSGNFAQGLAAAAQSLGVPCTIVMPIDAPAVKRERTKEFGARVVLTDHGKAPREEVAGKRAVRIANEDGLVLLHPFDDPFIVAGHASMAYEIGRVCKARNERLAEDVLCCVGGGGLIAGLALGLADLSDGLDADSASRVVPVEPQVYDALRQSLRAGRRVTVTGGSPSICDALQAPAPGKIPFAALMSVGTREAVTVTDEDVRLAMRTAIEALGIVLEPSGAVPLAAFICHPARWKDRDVVIIASGRNITAATLAGYFPVEQPSLS
jgi:threonine dehydratase